MKFFLLSLFFIASVAVQAQSGKVNRLPPGTYEIRKSAPLEKISSSEIILLDDNHYKLKNEKEVSNYKFSATAQRVLFLSGPLQGAYARIVVNSGVPAIVLPHKENEELGLKLADADVWAYYKKQ
jgi:hypothetical protein